jgi:hypothetical protein
MSALLVPPLVQPRSPEFPSGVFTIIFTVPGPEITSVESFTVNFCALKTVAAMGVEFTITCDAETN